MNSVRSRETALSLYRGWVETRLKRPGNLKCEESASGVKVARVANSLVQRVTPRRKHLLELKKAGPGMATADKVALLVMTELPALEISTLLHRLKGQLVKDPEAKYFSRVNQVSNCGCGCG